MIHYIIESRHTLKNSKGIEFEDVGYFKELVNIIYPMLSMASRQDEAKRYDCKSEANRDIKKHFSGRNRVKVLKITT